MLDHTAEHMRLKANDIDLEQLQTVVNRYCLSLTGSIWEAEDLAQDTWLKALAPLRAIGHSNPEAFLLRIAKNTWIDQVRRQQLLNRTRQLETAGMIVPAEHHSFFEMETAFQVLIEHLSPTQRTVFLLRDVFGYSTSEAANMLETTGGAIKAALHRARQSLHSVRDDLMGGNIHGPETEDLKAFLRVIVAAYQAGDITALVQLAQQDVIEPVVAIGIVQNGMALQHSVFVGGQVNSQFMAANTMWMVA